MMAAVQMWSMHGLRAFRVYEEFKKDKDCRRDLRLAESMLSQVVCPFMVDSDVWDLQAHLVRGLFLGQSPVFRDWSGNCSAPISSSSEDTWSSNQPCSWLLNLEALTCNQIFTLLGLGTCAGVSVIFLLTFHTGRLLPTM